MHFSTRGCLGSAYRGLVKPVLFRFDPEFVHRCVAKIGSSAGKFSFSKAILRHAFAYKSDTLEVVRDGIRFLNPVGLAAGFDWNGELTDVLPSVGFGFQTVGTVTWEPYGGNPSPRLGRFPKSEALLVNKGLQSLGAPTIIQRLEKKNFLFPVGISLAATNKHYTRTHDQLEDLRSAFLAFEQSKVQHAYYELNISCPNTFGGEPFTSCPRLRILLRSLDEIALKRPVYVKMPIDLGLTETRSLLRELITHDWVKGVVFGNLTKDHENPNVHPDDRREWKTRKGNLSGKPTFLRSLELIRMTRKEFGQRFTIIGTGGIFSPQDAEDKLLAGADLVQLITGMIYRGPQLPGEISAYLARRNDWRRGSSR